MSVKTLLAAGLIVFRRMSGNLEYLMLKASYGDYHWSPPKGRTFLYCSLSSILMKHVMPVYWKPRVAHLLSQLCNDI